MTGISTKQSRDNVIITTCASHCGGACVLKLHVQDGIIRHIETDDSKDPQLRACLRGRAYRQRVYASDRLLYPLKRTAKRGDAVFTRISWDEALDTISSAITRIRDTYGPASILHIRQGGDSSCLLHTSSRMAELLSLAGGCTETWGIPSFAGGVYAQQATYGTYYTCNTRDDLLNSRFIIMWGWNPASTITGVNTNWCLAQAKENGTKIVVVDPRFTNSVATLAHQWIPILPGTDGAMLLAMAYVIIRDNLQDQHFLDTYTIGFEKFRDYVTGVEDGIAKTPIWAEKITKVSCATVEKLARQYATEKPAALIAGIAPGRTAYGEQYHRIAITLASMTGNIGVHGGDAAGGSWQSAPPFGGYPYKVSPRFHVDNPVNELVAPPPEGSPIWYQHSKVHFCDVPDFIEKGKSGGYLADCKLIAVTNCSYVNSFPNVNRVTSALKSNRVEFIFVQEQFMTPTAKFADIILPTTTFLEKSDIVYGTGIAFYGYRKKAIKPMGECKSQLEIASLLASRLGISGFYTKSEDEHLREMTENSEIRSYKQFKKEGVYRIDMPEPYVAFKKQIEDPRNNPFLTPSGKIEIYSQQWANLNNPELPAIPKYIETWESKNDPLVKRYPLQLISTHFKRRANAQFENIPWLRELEPQAILINSLDAKTRDINDGDMVQVFNDRGKIIILAKVTERIIPGVVDIPNGAWFDPDQNGVDRGGCANVLIKDLHSPGGAFPYNTCLVEVEKS
ncbi:molybdopterin-dependent oxidoreductase [Chloroflexota bacterium]